MNRHLAFPFRVGPDGRTATPATTADHVRDELLQLILTAPGERPFIPEFGAGARKLIFEPTSDVLRGVVKARITQSVSRYLGHRLTLEALEVIFADNRIDIEIKYRPAGSPDSRVVKFQRNGS
jgi:uncharacterized protein